MKIKIYITAMVIMDEKMAIAEESDCFTSVIMEMITQNLTIIRARIMAAEDMEIREDVMIVNPTQTNDIGSRVELVPAH